MPLSLDLNPQIVSPSSQRNSSSGQMSLDVSIAPAAIAPAASATISSALDMSELVLPSATAFGVDASFAAVIASAANDFDLNANSPLRNIANEYLATATAPVAQESSIAQANSTTQSSDRIQDALTVIIAMEQANVERLWETALNLNGGMKDSPAVIPGAKPSAYSDQVEAFLAA